MEAILISLLQASLSEFTKINADLAATSNNLKASGDTADQIMGAIDRRGEVGHIEFSLFAPNGRV